MRLLRGSVKIYSLVLLVSISLLLSVLLLNTQEEDPWSKWKPGYVLMAPKTSVLAGHSSVKMSDGVFTYQFNLSQFAVEFPYMLHYKCGLVLDLPGLCRVPAGNLLLLLATKSHPAAIPRRAALRQTWAREGKYSAFVVKPFFLVAQSPDQAHMSLLAAEAKEFKDILLWDFTESHHNLSLKERCLIEWLHHNCKEAEFIFKGDDDEYVNPRALVKYLTETSNASKAVHGSIHKGSDSEREGKYKVTEAMYPSAKYPMFPSGGGFIIPGASIAALYRASTWMPVFPLDDVYFGFLGLAARVIYRHDYRFCVAGLRYNRCAYREVMVVHGIQPHELVYIWQAVHEEDPCDKRTFWIPFLVPLFVFVLFGATLKLCREVIDQTPRKIPCREGIPSGRVGHYVL